MALVDANQAAAQSFHDAADAADRLREQPKVAVNIAAAGAGGGDRAKAEAIRRGQHSEEVKEIVAAVRRDLARR